jgi:hypothetical protein
MMLLAWLIGAFVVGAINAMLAFVVFMFTTVIGVILLGIFAIIFVGNLLSPDEDEGQETDDEKAAGKLLAYRTETHMKSCRRGK